LNVASIEAPLVRLRGIVGVKPSSEWRPKNDPLMNVRGRTRQVSPQALGRLNRWHWNGPATGLFARMTEVSPLSTHVGDEVEVNRLVDAPPGR